MSGRTPGIVGSGSRQNLMPFFARCVHQRQPSHAVGTAATTAIPGPTTAPRTTVAAAAAPAFTPLRRESSRTSVRVLLMTSIVRPAARRRNSSAGHLRPIGPTYGDPNVDARACTRVHRATVSMSAGDRSLSKRGICFFIASSSAFSR